MAESLRLSEKSIAVLRLIADGHSYAQIVEAHPELTYLDIFNAAAEALRLHELNGHLHSAYQERLAGIKDRYPKAYEPWAKHDDAELAEMFRAGEKLDAMTEVLQRQPSALRARLVKLGLTSTKESVP